MKSRYSNSTSMKEARRPRDRSSLYQSTIERSLDPNVQLKIKQHSSKRSSHSKKPSLSSRSSAFPDLLVVRGATGGKTVIQRSTIASVQPRASRVCPSCYVPVGNSRLGTETIRCRGCNLPWHRACASRNWRSVTKNSQCPDCSYNKQVKRSSCFSVSMHSTPVNESIVTTWAPESQESDVDVTEEELDVGGPGFFDQAPIKELSFGSPKRFSSVAPTTSFDRKTYSSKNISQSATPFSLPSKSSSLPEPTAAEEEICPICDGDCACLLGSPGEEIDVCEVDVSTYNLTPTPSPLVSNSVRQSFSPSPEYISRAFSPASYTRPSSKYVSRAASPVNPRVQFSSKYTSRATSPVNSRVQFSSKYTSRAASPISPRPQFSSKFISRTPHFTSFVAGSSPSSPNQEMDDYIDITDSPVKRNENGFTLTHPIHMEDLDISLNHDSFARDSRCTSDSPYTCSPVGSYKKSTEPFLDVMNSPTFDRSQSNLEFCQDNIQLHDLNVDITVDKLQLPNSFTTELTYESMVEMSEDELDFDEVSEEEEEEEKESDVNSVSDVGSVIGLSEAFQDLEFSDDIEEDLEERHHLREREELYLIQKVMSGTQDWDSQDELESSPALAPCKPESLTEIKFHRLDTTPSTQNPSFVGPDHPWFTYNPTYLSDLLDEPPVLNAQAHDRVSPQLNLTQSSCNPSNFQPDVEFITQADSPGGSGDSTPLNPPSIDWSDLQFFPYTQAPLSRSRVRSATLPSKLKHSSFYRPLARPHGTDSQESSTFLTPVPTYLNGAATPSRLDFPATIFTPMNQASEPPSPGFFMGHPINSEPESNAVPTPTLALEDVIDVSQLTSSPVLAPTHPLEPYFADALARWERIPVTSFRQRSVAHVSGGSMRQSTRKPNLPKFSSALPSQMNSLSNSPRTNSMITCLNQLNLTSCTQSLQSTPKEPLSELPSPKQMSSPIYNPYQSKRKFASSRNFIRNTSIRIHHKNFIDKPQKASRRQLSRSRLARSNAKRNRSFDVRHPILPPSKRPAQPKPLPHAPKGFHQVQFRRQARALVQTTRRRARQAKMAQLFGFPLEFGP